jgi:hypothetical protein
LRAGPLSDTKVISLLNSSFVPVYASNEDYTGAGKAPIAEKAERQRIYGDFIARRMGANDVHIYVVTGDGQPVESLEVAKATQPDVLYSFLHRVAAKLSISPGGPAVPPHTQSAPPAVEKDAMVFHTVARGSRQGSWREVPGENWTVLRPAEWTLLLPHSAAKVGDSWDVPETGARKLLTNFYPQTEDTTDKDRNLIDECGLHMKVIAMTEGTLRVRIEGSLKMRRRQAPGSKDYLPVSAAVIGFMDISTGTPQIRRFNLTTWKATYGEEAFDVAQRYLPPEGLELLRR